MANLQFTASIDAAQFNKTLDDIEKKIKGLNSGGSVLSSIVETHDAIQALTAVADAIVKVRGEFRSWEGQMAGVLNSRVEANALMAEVMTMAGQSPLNVEEIAQGANALIAFGADAKTAMADLQMLGDVSLSVGVPLNELAELYGKMRESGAASSDELTKMAGKNIPVYEELARVLHTNTDGVKTFANEGKISFGQVQQAFMNMTNVGGIFHGVMQKEAETVAGQINALKNAFESMLNEIGQSQSGLLSMSVDGLSLLVENYDKVEKILTVLIATYGTYRAAVITIDIAHKLINSSKVATLYIEMARGLGTLTTATKLQAVALGIQTKAQAALNAVMNVNPYVAAATAIAALAATIWVLHDNTNSAVRAQELLNKQQDEIQKKREELVSKTQSLMSVINSETSSKYQQIQAYLELQALYPNLLGNITLETFKKKEATKAQLELNKAIDQFEISNLEENYKSASKNVSTLQDRIKNFNVKDQASAETFKVLEKELETLQIFAEKSLKDLNHAKELQYEATVPLKKQKEDQEAIRHSIVGRIKQTKEVIESEEKLGVKGNFIKSIMEKITLQNLIVSLEKADGKIKNLTDRINDIDIDFGKSLDTAVTEKNVQKILDLSKKAKTENQISALANAARELKGSLELTSNEYKKLDTLYKSLTSKGKTELPVQKGSINYWQEESRKASSARDSLNPDISPNEYEKYTKRKLEADIKIEELKKKYEVKTFEQTLEEKKKQYSEYNQWVNEIGKASADKQFEELLKSGESYKDYLDKQIAALETKVNSKDATEEDKDNLKKAKSESLKAYKSELDIKKTQYELYNKWVEAYGKESADRQFKTLKDAGKGFQNYLKNEIAILEARINNNTATADERDNLITLKARIEPDTSALDEFKEQISKMLQDVENETEKISRLNDEKFVVSSTVTDDKEKEAKLKELDKQIVDAEKRRIELFKNFNAENNAQESNRLRIQKKYADLRIAAEKEYQDKTSEIYLETIKKINEKEREEIAATDTKLQSFVQKVQKEIQSIVESGKRESIESYISKVTPKLSELENKSSEGKTLATPELEAYQSLLKSITDAKVALVELDFKNYQTLAGLLGQIGTSFQGLNGDVGEFAGALLKVSSKSKEFFEYIKAAKISKEFAAAAKAAQKMAEQQKTEKAASAAEEAVNGAQKAAKAAQSGLIGLGTMLVTEAITSFVAQKKINEELAKNTIKLQKEYNRLLAEEIRLNAFRSSNKYVKDYRNIFTEASKGLHDNLGLMNKFFYDLENSLGLIVKKYNGILGIGKFNIEIPVLFKYPEMIKTLEDGTRVLNIEIAQAAINSGLLSDSMVDLLQDGINLQKSINDYVAGINDMIDELIGDLGSNLRNALVQAFRDGTDAAQAFNKVLGDVIADVSSKLLFSAIFNSAFDELSKRFKDSFDIANGGDFSIQDDLDEWNKKYKDLTKQFEERQKELDNWLIASGYDSNLKNDSSNSLSGSIKSISEETAGVLAGQMNAIRMTQATNLDVNRNQLLALTEIATNSRFLKHLERLESIEKKISNNNGDIRAGGGY
ncbi:tape measure protein [Emticicia sp. TH156]|uniref:tape measure protein n=1 Tax=Emticicia sp. TH156 TaxID=2067454 RepID=UPI000C7566B2|nr:tape measure protein [Emticicia sp. TH156]PLK44462.1 hypothetical protein C0V77_11805 [Emticicia sp. TH156]